MILPVTISKDLFNPAFLPLLENTARVNVLYGGAGSGKSYFIAERYIIKWLEGGHNFLCLRKVKEANKDSTFSLICQVLKAWKIPDDWYTINKSTLKITNNINGSEFIFRGMLYEKDREKVKSITFSNGVLTDIWMEEASEFSIEDYLQLNLRLRGLSTVDFQITLSFNPVSDQNWTKKAFIDRVDEDITILKTTYLDNKFVGKDYAVMMDKMKTLNPDMYAIYGLGDWGVLGGLIYSNYVIEDLSKMKFENDLGGMDFGFNHPSCVLKVNFKDDELYIRQELHESGLTNTDLINRVKRDFDRSLRSVGDSAEPDRILEFQRNDLNVVASIKGAGSVKYGIDWIRSKRMHIDPSCTGFVMEVQQYSYKKDRDGNETDEPQNFKDDAMAALRYAVESVRHERSEVKYIRVDSRTW